VLATASPTPPRRVTLRAVPQLVDLDLVETAIAAELAAHWPELEQLVREAGSSRARRAALGAVWVEASGVEARQRCLRAGWECAASANRRDDLADRFGGEVRLSDGDRMTR
jgi:hypothetical protein